jgi:hypothetical protein
MSLCRPCKRCRIPRGVLRTRHTAVGIADQVVEHVWLCNPCRSDAAVENMKALWRSNQPWREEVDLRDLIWD